MRIIPSDEDAIRLPWCDQCGKVVDAIERRDDSFRAAIVFVAYCHGEHETAELLQEEMEDCPLSMRGMFRFGAAFKTRRLPVAIADGKRA